MYQPRTTFEGYLSSFMRGVAPYWGALTYNFHVDSCKRSGISIDELFKNKFYREAPIHWHMYAQYFHPTTLHERVRDVAFFRRTATLFKGFSVPEWAQHKNRGHANPHDNYGRMLWEEAQHNLRSEWTPDIFLGQRLEPNLLNGLIIENVGQGNSSKLFYNEVPKPTKYRFGGRFDGSKKKLLSFKYAEQDYENLFGFDTNTPEGRQQLKDEIKKWKKMTPEIWYDVDAEADWVNRPYLSKEPYFRRTWKHYREF